MVSLWFCEKSGCDSGGYNLHEERVQCYRGGYGIRRALFIHAVDAVFSLCAKCGRTLVQLPPSIILERGLYPVVPRDRSAVTVAAV